MKWLSHSITTPIAKHMLENVYIIGYVYMMFCADGPK